MGVHVFPILNPPPTTLPKSFFKNHKRVLNFSKSLFYIYWDDHIIFILQFVDVVYHTDWCADIENPCIPGINPTWSWCMIISMYCWIQIGSILLRIFAGVLSDVYFGLELIRKCFLGHILEMTLFLKCLTWVSRFKPDNPRYSNYVVSQKPSSVLSRGIRSRYVILKFLWSLSETYMTLWWAVVLE